MLAPRDVFIQIDGPPRPWKRPRFSSGNGKPRVFDPEDKIRKQIVLSIKSQVKNVLVGAVSVKIEFYFGVQSKKKWGLFKPSRPDIDNLAKNVLEMLQGLVVVDDAQIVQLTAVKKYDQNSYTNIWVREIED